MRNEVKPSDVENLSLELLAIFNISTLLLRLFGSIDTPAETEKKKTKNADERKGVWNICLTLHFNSSARRRFAILFTHSQHTHTHTRHTAAAAVVTTVSPHSPIRCLLLLYVFFYISLNMFLSLVACASARNFTFH